jgi:hypothetical protein
LPALPALAVACDSAITLAPFLTALARCDLIVANWSFVVTAPHVDIKIGVGAVAHCFGLAREQLNEFFIDAALNINAFNTTA